MLFPKPLHLTLLGCRMPRPVAFDEEIRSHWELRDKTLTQRLKAIAKRTPDLETGAELMDLLTWLDEDRERGLNSLFRSPGQPLPDDFDD